MYFFLSIDGESQVNNMKYNKHCIVQFSLLSDIGN